MQEQQTTTPGSKAPEVLLEADPQVMSHVATRLEEARGLVENGQNDAAWDICEDLLRTPNLSVNSGAKIALVIRDLGKPDIAERIQSTIFDKIMAGMDRLRDPERALLPAAEALADLGHFDEAEKLSRRAFAAAPGNLTVAVGLAAFFMYRERTDEAVDVAREHILAWSDPFNSAIHFAMVFNHLGAKEAAKTCLELAKPHCKSKTQRAKLDYFLASNGMQVSGLDQHGMAVELFDEFAENYDQQLTKLENNGPNMVYSALEQLDIPKTQTRRVLDAGCGTGLCGGFLRPYAKELFGIDLSVKMLEVSRGKHLYDYLARTDLSVKATYPEGRFDMIVCADVFVYFGALNVVLKNLHDILSPGGWLLLTVEDENDPNLQSGFKLYPTGRYKHSVGYMTRTLAEAGFPKPKFLRHARLRNELAKPILGTVIAVQKPALTLF